MKFSELEPGTIFMRMDVFGEWDKCIKLRKNYDLWNTVYLDGDFAGGFCTTDDNRNIEVSKNAT